MKTCFIACLLHCERLNQHMHIEKYDTQVLHEAFEKQSDKLSLKRRRKKCMRSLEYLAQLMNKTPALSICAVCAVVLNL